MWHFGSDSLNEYTDKRFKSTRDDRENALLRIYTKDLRTKESELEKERQEYPNKRRFFDCSTCQLSSNVGSGSIYMGSLQASLSRYSLSFISLSLNYCESCNSPLLLEFMSTLFYFVKTANDLNMNLGFKRHLIYKN